MLKHAVIKNGPSLEQEEQFAGVSTEVQLAVVVDNDHLLKCKESRIITTYKALPNSILSLILIFEHGTEEDKVDFPILCSHVNSRFRNIALNSPTLWNSITYHGGNRSYDEIDARLARSKAVPLDIIAKKMSETEHANVMLDLLLPHLRRWRSLDLEVWEQDPAETIIAALVDEAPMLETLHLTGYAGDSFEPFSGKTPRLRDLSVKNMPLVWESDLFSTVQRLYVHSGTWQNPELLSGWQNLQQLTIRADPLQSFDFDFENEPIALPHLTTLELNGVTEEHIVQLLAFVNMPRLRRLLFTHIKDSVNPAVYHLFPLNQLRELRLHATEMCQENLLRVLRQMKFLHTISFEDSSPIPTFIEALTPSVEQEDTWVCPNVQRFRVIAFEKDNAHRLYDDTDIQLSLSQMLKTRSRGVTAKPAFQIEMCVFEGERNEVTRHATEWGVERPYKHVRQITF